MMRLVGKYQRAAAGALPDFRSRGCPAYRICTAGLVKGDDVAGETPVAIIVISVVGCPGH